MARKIRRSVALDGPDPVDVHVGSVLARQRKMMGANQTELADAIGVTFQQVQKYEKGANRISASRLFMAARFLGISVTDFFPEVDDTGQQVHVPNAERVPGETKLVRNFRRLNLKDGEAVSKFIATLANNYTRDQ